MQKKIKLTCWLLFFTLLFLGEAFKLTFLSILDLIIVPIIYFMLKNKELTWNFKLINIGLLCTLLFTLSLDVIFIESNKDENVMDNETKIENKNEVKKEDVKIAENENNKIKDAREENKTINKEDHTTKDIKEEKKEELTIDKIKGKVSGSIGDGDSVLNVLFNNNVIDLKIELGDPAPLTLRDLAISRYGSISDDLLKIEGWDTLKVTFNNVGTIQMNANNAMEKTISGMKYKYFQILDYENQI